MTETRFCRVCGELLPALRFRRAPRRGARRVCRACESRRRMRYRWLLTGRPVPEKYRDPELTLGEHLRILDAELHTREGSE